MDKSFQYAAHATNVTGVRLDQALAVDPCWYACHKPNPAASLRMFCFPYAGGGTAIFRSWQDRLPSTVEVYPIELPGRGARWKEPPFLRLPPLVQSIAAAIIGILDKPFVFFGHSMGGLLSYELAQYLRIHYGLEPAHLFISGCRAPHAFQDDKQTYMLPDSEFLERVRELNGTPSEILEDAELMTMVLPIIRADFAICDNYTYSPLPPLSCPITTFGGTEDTEVSVDHLVAWQEHTKKRFVMHPLPGDHFFINSAQSFLLDKLSNELLGLFRRSSNKPSTSFHHS